MSQFTGTLADVRVRRALSMAIDRAGIAKTLFYGTADPLYSVAGPGFWQTSPAKAVYSAAYQKLVQAPDVTAARTLVQQAGADGKQFSIGYAADSPTQAQLAEVLQQAGTPSASR
ncbi:hypothetical protein GXW82_19040 [Streptacidiphilus sp. 4-A2]|nr:hypothetical protein [Streptacidiphilus sp. 4-A2]